MTLEYHLAELFQHGPSPDREAVLTQGLEQYAKFLTRLDEYNLLNKDDRKLFEKYMADPSSFTLAPVNDAVARRDTKVRRFREEKDLKQKLEVVKDKFYYAISFAHTLFSILPRTQHVFKMTTMTPGSSI